MGLGFQRHLPAVGAFTKQQRFLRLARPNTPCPNFTCCFVVRVSGFTAAPSMPRPRAVPSARVANKMGIDIVPTFEVCVCACVCVGGEGGRG